MKNTIGKVFDGVGKEIDGCSCSNLHPLDKKSKWEFFLLENKVLSRSFSTLKHLIEYI